MPKDTYSLQLPEIGEGSREHPYRHSLQPRGAAEGAVLRLTQSQNYKKKRKKVQVPPIPEVEAEGEKEVRISLDVVKDQAKMARPSKSSRKGSQASQVVKVGIDNVAFEVEDGLRISRVGSAASSVRSSMRDPSVQSLAVVREQYCCCSRWSRFERTLFLAIGVLTVIIVALLTAIALLATNDKEKAQLSALFNV